MRHEKKYNPVISLLHFPRQKYNHSFTTTAEDGKFETTISQARPSDTADILVGQCSDHHQTPAGLTLEGGTTLSTLCCTPVMPAGLTFEGGITLRHFLVRP
jgi:hypothetical protein